MKSSEESAVPGSHREQASNTSAPGQPFRILILDNVVSNMGDGAIVLAMKQAFEEAFGPGTIVKNCFHGWFSDPGVFAKFYPDLNFVPAIWNAAFDGKTNLPEPLVRLMSKTAPVRFTLQATLSRYGLPFFLLNRGEQQLFREYQEADLIVVSGGGFLNTSWTSVHQRPKRIGQYELAYRLGKPLAFYAGSIGPFKPDDPFARMLRPYMEGALCVLCRDAESVRVVRETCGVRTENVHQTIDTAMLLEPRASQTPLAPPKAHPLRIGFCIHKWHWAHEGDPKAKQSAFEARIGEVCKQMLARPDTELMLITTQQGREGYDNDTDVIERVYAMLPAEVHHRVQMVTPFIPPREFMHLMGQCDIVVSSRLHGGILSLGGGAPVVALAYEPKTVGFMKQIGLEDWTLSMGDSTAEEILAVLNSMLDDMSETRRRQAAASARGRQLAGCNHLILCEALEARQSSEQAFPV